MHDLANILFKELYMNFKYKDLRIQSQLLNNTH